MKHSESACNAADGKMPPSQQALWLLVYMTVSLSIPDMVLACTEIRSAWSLAAGILLPAGIYLLSSCITRCTGITAICMLPVVFLCSFQIVLLYLYGNSVIAADMYINLMTTNPDEASELLHNLYPAVILVCLIYLPLLYEAFRQAHRRMLITRKMRRHVLLAGGLLTGVGAAMLTAAYASGGRNIISDEIFPINAAYNFYYALKTKRNALNYPVTSASFSHEVRRGDSCDRQQIYVYIIGEASRAANWELYGYDRPTNPHLTKRSDMALFRNVITQSNTTHKSVPLFLSSAPIDNHSELYRRKGLASLFREAGFRTHFISNQSSQGDMVDHLAKEADEVVYIGAPRHDLQLLRMMERIIETDEEHDLLIILHCYGSHFSYHQRYPREFARFQPDNDVAIKPQNAEMIINAYDNSIVYTDYFLDCVLEYMDSLGACSAVLYCSDHGEDLFDDERGRFLHASPTVTYYQLHVPCFAWFSKEYALLHRDKVSAARRHAMSAATTRSMFHTLADIASLESPYINRSVSLASDEFDRQAARYYLNDHNCAVAFDRKTGITEADCRLFATHGISLNTDSRH